MLGRAEGGALGRAGCRGAGRWGRGAGEGGALGRAQGGAGAPTAACRCRVGAQTALAPSSSIYPPPASRVPSHTPGSPARGFLPFRELGRSAPAVVLPAPFSGRCSVVPLPEEDT